MSTLLNISTSAPERIVKVSDGEGFAVRGLNPLQVVALYRRRSAELEPIFKRIIDAIAQTGSVVNSGIEIELLSLLADAPTLVAEIIAIGSGGDPAAQNQVSIVLNGEQVELPLFDAIVEKAKHLTMPVQMEALQAIGDLTFTSDMPPGKFFALATTLARKVTGAMKDLISPPAAPNGSGAYGGPSIS